MGSARCSPPKRRSAKGGGKETAPPGPSRPVKLAEIMVPPESDARKKRGAEDEGDDAEAPKEKRPPRQVTVPSPPPTLTEVEMATPRGTPK